MTPSACLGHIRADGARLGLCLLCARLVDRGAKASQMLEPAARQITTGGTWACTNFSEPCAAPALA